MTVLYCHCKDCRKATGSVYGTNLFVDKETVVSKGVLIQFIHTADSGNQMAKWFCPKYGTLMFGSSSGRPGILTVRADTLDDTSIVKPVMNVYTDSMVPSSLLDSNLECAKKCRTTYFKRMALND
ncbi:MAG: hypothetical protein CMM58_05380 [Rhodospirillaceae bacterium]|nr:hypothetical protein [Rhodospirillaceae bacterium]